MRRDDLGSWIQISGCSSRVAAAAPIAPRSLCAESCICALQGTQALPGRSSRLDHCGTGMDGLLLMSVTMPSCTCSGSSAIATGRTSEDSVTQLTRHRMIRRRRACYGKTPAAGTSEHVRAGCSGRLLVEPGQIRQSCEWGSVPRIAGISKVALRKVGPEGLRLRSTNDNGPY
jgi:hypothetical protein